MSGRIRRYTFPKAGDVRDELARKYPDLGDLAEIYAGNTGTIVHKWHHYLPLYERYFAAWRNRPVRFLEIGVSKGGSLAMWRKYFGPQAIIFGIDINEACAKFNGVNAQVRIGSQADGAFLNGVVAEMGGLDLVLDDGSHRMEHVEASLDILFPHLTMGGSYMIEDLHTAYWPRWGGGVKEPANFFNSVRRLIDDMHHWCHGGPPRRPALAGKVSGLHIHDSIVVLDKLPIHEPVHSRVGERDRADDASQEEVA